MANFHPIHTGGKKAAEYAANRRQVGGKYEQKAADYLHAHGMKILEKNYRSRNGEIDLIGRDEKYLVFIEVKYRKSRRNGDPSEAVTRSKRQRIRQTAQFYLYSHRYGEDTPCRFDVVSILDGEISWIRNAF